MLFTILLTISLTACHATGALQSTTLPAFITLPYKLHGIRTCDIETVYEQFITSLSVSARELIPHILSIFKHRMTASVAEKDALIDYKRSGGVNLGLITVSRMSFAVQESSFIRVLGPTKPTRPFYSHLSLNGFGNEQSAILRDLILEIDNCVAIFEQTPLAIKTKEWLFDKKDLIECLYGRVEFMLSCLFVITQLLPDYEESVDFKSIIDALFEVVNTDLKAGMQKACRELMAPKADLEREPKLVPTKVHFTTEEWSERVRKLSKTPTTLDNIPAKLMEYLSTCDDPESTMKQIITQTDSFKVSLLEKSDSHLLNTLLFSDYNADLVRLPKVDLWTWFLRFNTLLGISDREWSFHVEMPSISDLLLQKGALLAIFTYVKVNVLLYENDLKVTRSSVPQKVSVLSSGNAIGLLYSEAPFYTFPSTIFKSLSKLISYEYYPVVKYELSILDSSLQRSHHELIISQSSNIAYEQHKVFLLKQANSTFSRLHRQKSIKARTLQLIAIQLFHNNIELVKELLLKRKFKRFTGYTNRINQAGIYAMLVDERTCSSLLIQKMMIEYNLERILNGNSSLDVLPYLTRFVTKYGQQSLLPG